MAEYELQHYNGHYIIVDEHGVCHGSADTYEEGMKDIEELYEQANNSTK